jgi:hypothetical protein
LRSEEVRLAESPQEPPEYILGDSIELSIFLRHKKNVVKVEAVFTPRADPDKRIVFEDVPQLVRREGDYQISQVEFDAEVTADWVPDEYLCAYLAAYYPPTESTPSNRGERLGIPEDLRFKVVAEPWEEPEVVGWQWGSEP